MNRSRLAEINNRLVIAAKEGETYNGIYRGQSAEGFVVEVEEVFIVGHKDDLTPEQVKTLQNGAEISFTKANVENLTEVLIPSEKLAPLSNTELLQRLQTTLMLMKHAEETSSVCPDAFMATN